MPWEKDRLKDLSKTFGNLAGQYQGSMLPKYQQTETDIGDFTSRMRGIATDESKQGYSSDTVNAMRAAQTGALAGARRSTMQDVNRNIAASGMGNTGMGIRQAANMGRDFAAQQRTANRDVDLAQAEAKRSDKWQATGAETQGYGLGMNALAGEQGVYQGVGDIYSKQQSALDDAAKLKGFWGTFGSSFANSLGSGLGTGLVGKIF
jgi:hypothetical protein